jgi:signal transduction histidine kinase
MNQSQVSDPDRRRSDNTESRLSSAAVAEQNFTFSSEAASQAQKRLALVVVLGLFLIFVVLLGPFSNIQPGRTQAFVPAYTMVIFVTDAVTAVFLFAEFSIVRTRALLAISSGYLFNALIVLAWYLTFPDLSVPGSLLGGLQSTPYIHFFWHAGFPVSVIVYALLKDRPPEKRYWHGSVIGAVSFSVALTAIIVFVVASIFVIGDPVLPRLQADPLHLNPQWLYLAVPIVLLSGIALIALWTSRRSALDFWLMVVMCAYGIEMYLSFFPIPARYTLNWYAGKVFSLLSSSIVLVALLYGVTALYTRLQNALTGAKQAVRSLERERADRLANVQAATAAMAHELRQPLTAIATQGGAGVNWLKRTPPELNKAHECFRSMIDASLHANEIIAAIRDLYKKTPTEYTTVQINDVVREVLASVQDDLRVEAVLATAEYHEDLPKIHAAHTQVQQAILNLVKNGIEAMRSVAPDKRRLRVVTGFDGNSGVAVYVQDSGPGISSDQHDRIFEPFFTTKPNGTGLGLSICRAIAEDHGGKLRLSKSDARGTSFELVLPVNWPASTRT